jgi:hypothetical protein
MDQRMPLFSSARTRRGVARLLGACLLFTQAALAAVSCVSPAASAIDAFAAAPPPCHEAPPANLCVSRERSSRSFRWARSSR